MCRKISITIAFLFSFVCSYGQRSNPTGNSTDIYTYKGGISTTNYLQIPSGFIPLTFDSVRMVWVATGNMYFHDGNGRIQLLSYKDSTTIKNWAVAGSDGQTISLSGLDSLSIIRGNTIWLPYLRKDDTASLSSRINQKFNTSDTGGHWLYIGTPLIHPADTAAMLAGYVRVLIFMDSLAAHWAAIQGKVGYGDTQNMLLNYALEAQMMDFLDMKVAYGDSGNVYNSIYGVDTAKAALRAEIALRELVSNKVTSFASPDNTTYPTTAAVNTLVFSYKPKSDSVEDDGYTRRDRTQHIADSVAGLIPSVAGYLLISDSITIYATQHGVDTGKATIRAEIAALPIPYYADSLLRAFDSLAAHNTRLLTWEHSAAYSIVASDVTNWNTAYNNRITSLTTTGTSGPATLIGNVLNIPEYAPDLSSYATLLDLDTGVNNTRTWAWTTFLTTADAASTYQPIGTYFTNSDTSNTVATRAWRQKGIDSAVALFWNFYKDTTTTSFTTSMTPIIPLAHKMYMVQYNITAQSGALLLNNPNITMANGQLLLFVIEDNGTPVALTYGADYRAGTDISSLPSTTTANKKLYLEFIRNTSDGKLDLIGKANGY